MCVCLPKWERWCKFRVSLKLRVAISGHGSTEQRKRVASVSRTGWPHWSAAYLPLGPRPHMATVETVDMPQDQYIWTHLNTLWTLNIRTACKVFQYVSPYTVYSVNMHASFNSKSMFEICVQQMCFSNLYVSRTYRTHSIISQDLAPLPGPPKLPPSPTKKRGKEALTTPDSPVTLGHSGDAPGWVHGWGCWFRQRGGRYKCSG